MRPFQLMASVLALFQFTFVSAQVETFKLSDYKLTDINYRSWDNTLNYNGNQNKLFARVADTVLTKDYYNRLDYTGNITLYQNSRPKQRRTNIGLYFSGFRQGNEYTKRSESKYYFWQTSVQLSDMHRFYHAKNIFFEVEPKFSYNFYQDYRYSEDAFAKTESRTSNNRHIYSVGVPVKVGQGRLERVEDARQAVYLLQQLKKRGRLRTEVSHEKILELTAFVSKLRNKRFFDFRLQRIYQLEQLDSFFIANDILSKHDAKYFAATMDYWMYGGGPVRSSGKRFSMAFYPIFGQSFGNYTQYGTSLSTKTEYDNRMFQLFAGPEYRWEKVINQKWQSSFFASAYVGSRKSKLKDKFLASESERDVLLPGFQFSARHILGFYPTTRTFLTWSNYFRHDRITEPKEPPFGTDVFNYQQNIVGSDLGLTYYVSPRFRVYSSVGWRVEYQMPDANGAHGGFSPLLLIPDSYFEPDELFSEAVSGYAQQLRDRSFKVFLKITYAIF